LAQIALADLKPDFTVIRWIVCIVAAFYITYSIWLAKIISAPKWNIVFGGAWWNNSASPQKASRIVACDIASFAVVNVVPQVILFWN